MKDHSQYGEASLLIEYFKANPPRHHYLVDVGAFGIRLSNTFNLLKEHGWSGLLIEAMPREGFFQSMVDAFQGDQRVSFMEGVAIGDYEGEGVAWLNKGDGHRSLIRDWESNGTMKIPVRPLAPVLEERNVPHDFDLLSVDAEGFDQRILECLMATPYRPRVIVYEKGEDNHSFLERHGYRPLFETKGNLAYERK